MNPLVSTKADDSRTRSDEAARLQERARTITYWLLGEQRLRSGRMTFLIDSFARRLRDAGMPLERASLHMPQLHPQMAARSFMWDVEAGGAAEMGFQHSARDSQAYTASPVRLIFEGGGAARHRLDGQNAENGPAAYPILDDLIERGFTDYVILPLPFGGGINNALSLATRRPGGFEDEDRALVEAVLPAFTALIELQQTRRTARDLLSTYVGPNTGERIFNGTIRRGDGEVIHAILWFCDLRGFTALSETMPLDQVIELLNTYFDCMAGPVTNRGGEVLKFVGDAMLAIFSCDAENATECDALGAALSAAEEAATGIAALSEVRRAVGQVPLDCGISLHIGDVMYGNIGAADRLDFTVIGPAVNLVCRLESLCAELDRQILVSSDIARLAPHRFDSHGYHQFKGMAEPREVFSLVDPRPPV